MSQQNPLPSGLRIGVVGGGCSGFSYSMSFENAPGVMDKVYTFDGLKVYVDATSAMYLNGCVVDYAKLPLEVAWGQATLNPTAVAASKLVAEPVWVKPPPTVAPTAPAAPAASTAPAATKTE